MSPAWLMYWITFTAGEVWKGEKFCQLYLEGLSCEHCQKTIALEKAFGFTNGGSSDSEKHLHLSS